MESEYLTVEIGRLGTEEGSTHGYRLADRHGWPMAPDAQRVERQAAPGTEPDEGPPAGELMK